MSLLSDGCNASEVAVVVEQRQPSPLGASRDDEIRDGQSVLAAAGKQPLHLQRAVEDRLSRVARGRAWRSRRTAVCVSALRAE